MIHDSTRSLTANISFDPMQKAIPLPRVHRKEISMCSDRNTTAIIIARTHHNKTRRPYQRSKCNRVKLKTIAKALTCNQ
ncbi:hypothetical protein EYC84_001271 [Monilinia fructicola]|uniref:Uncharacterized protein n=1 Tax=Monilinia fructicola TaxID=38448 RepID=A0A5M9JRW2_MONFR|nr:hypothetical protein EYC84_001271 [Monilinia fructicola]